MTSSLVRFKSNAWHFLFCAVGSVLRATQLPIQRVHRTYSNGAMLPMRKANHSRPWSVEDKKAWGNNPHQSTPSLHRENISLFYEYGASCKSKHTIDQNVKELKMLRW